MPMQSKASNIKHDALKLPTVIYYPAARFRLSVDDSLKFIKF